MDDLFRDEEDDPKTDAGEPTPTGIERKRQRAAATATIRRDAEEFIAGILAAEFAAENVLVIKGRYLGDLERLRGLLFVVSPVVNQRGRAVDVAIQVAPGLPGPSGQPTPEQMELFVDLNASLTTIKTVCQRMSEKANGGRLRSSNPTAAERADSLLDRYVRKLAGIGRLGLQGPHAPLGRLALNGLRAEFVAHEAGRIKNGYVRSLGATAGLAALVCIMLFAYAALPPTTSFLSQHRIFLLAATGAAVGSWLSFSIRRVTLAFDDLGILEEDLLDPSLRVIFVILLTWTVCLLFWTGTVNVAVGDLKTVAIRMPVDTVIGATAVLVGLFCGIGERALATAISGRAAGFVKGVGGA